MNRQRAAQKLAHEKPGQTLQFIPMVLSLQLLSRFRACFPPLERLLSLLMSDVTQILNAIEQGDPKAAGQLLPLVYKELRQLAAQKLAQEKPGQTLDPTALVHEAYLRLARRGDGSRGQERHWDSRGHFFTAAAEAMRRILVERARRKGRHKHGGQRTRADIDLASLACPLPAADLLALDEAMTRLAAAEPVRAQLVRLRFYAGLSNDDAAKVLGISSATAKRYWRYARAWLHREIAKEAE
jgi:RNA polymerase sigma factor (TIGR02999 family)